MRGTGRGQTDTGVATGQGQGKGQPAEGHAPGNGDIITINISGAVVKIEENKIMNNLILFFLIIKAQPNSLQCILFFIVHCHKCTYHTMFYP